MAPHLGGGGFFETHPGTVDRITALREGP